MYPDKLPVTIPKSDWEKIKELLKEMALNLNNANRIATEFVLKNPELVTTLVIVGAADIIGGVVSEILSVGTSSAPSFAMVVSGVILITVIINK